MPGERSAGPAPDTSARRSAHERPRALHTCRHARAPACGCSGTSRAARSTQSARAAPARSVACASRRPAKILCMVYQGTPTNGLPLRLFSSCVAPSGNPHDEPVALAGFQLVDDVVDALPEHRVASRRVHHRTRAQVVPERMSMAADLDPRLLRLPTAIHRRLGRKTRVDAKVVQQPVGLERQQIFRVQGCACANGPGSRRTADEIERGRTRGPRRSPGAIEDGVARREPLQYLAAASADGRQRESPNAYQNTRGNRARTCGRSGGYHAGRCSDR